MMEHYDLTQAEIVNVVRRMELAFQRRPILPFQSLQYRLGETGQFRIHPYALKRALTAVSRGSQTARSSETDVVKELEPLLFSSTSLDAAKAEILLQERTRTLKVLAESDWTAGHTAFTKTLAGYVGKLEPLGPRRLLSRRLSGILTIEASSCLYRIAETTSGSPIHVWLTHDPDWLRPDEPQLWTILESCRVAGARLLVIARCIDTASFVLFKALGIRGLQYYNMWVPQKEWARANSASDQLGWFNVKAGQKASAHSILSKVNAAVEHLRQTDLDPHVMVSLDLARDAGLATAQFSAITQLIEWAENVPVSLPEKWINTLRRFEAWGGEAPLTIAPAALALARQGRKPRKQAGGAETTHTTTASEILPPRTTVSRVPVRGW